MMTVAAEELRRQFLELLGESQRVVITCHQNPDGDAVGSVTALASMLRRAGMEVAIVAPNDFPDFLKWLPLASEIVFFDKQTEEAQKLMDNTQLLFCLDYNSPSRTGEVMETAVRECGAHKILLDHHLDPELTSYTLAFSHPEMCSTCEVLLWLAQDMGWTDGLTADEATSLYTGMMTDTGAFTYASSRPEVYEAISILLRTGIDKDKIYRRVFWVSTPDRMRLMGYLLYVKMSVMAEGRASLMTLTRQERKMFHLKNGDTEGFVNLPLEMQGMRLSIFLREDTEQKDIIRVSLRSVDDFPCNKMAVEFFNGGGHLNASGGRLRCSMEEAEEIVKAAIKKYFGN